MTLAEETRDRLADVVELQPTKNSELQERWGMDSGSDVHQFLESELKEHYFRDDNSLIRATPEAAELVDVEPGIVSDPDSDGAPSRIRVPALHAQIVDVLPEMDESGDSVVSVLHALRDTYDVDSSAEEVRSALQSLRRKDVVEVIYRTVPTFRMAVPKDELEVSIVD